MQDPKLYVHALLEVHNKYKVMVEAAFKGDAGFIQALDKVQHIQHTCKQSISILSMYMYVESTYVCVCTDILCFLRRRV